MRLFIGIVLALTMCNVALATNLPTSTAHPHAYITSERLSDMRAKQAANEPGWAFVKSRGDYYLSTYPYQPPPIAAIQALAYNVDNTLTTHRDRAIQLLFDMYVDQGSGKYWVVNAIQPTMSTLAADIDSTTATILLTSAAGFTLGGLPQAYIAIDDELISFSGVSGNTLTGCVRGAGGSTAASHVAPAVVEDLASTYGGGDKIRGAGPWGLLAFDWLYNSLSAQQRLDFQSKAVLWGRVWALLSNAPTGANSIFDHDSDQLSSIAEIFNLIGFALYNDNPYAVTAFDNSDGLMQNIVIGKYISQYFYGGIWGEGTNYSALTMQFPLRAAFLNKERRNLPYPQSVTDFISGAIKGWWHLTYPGNTGLLAYSDMEGFTGDYLTLQGHNRLELSYVLQGMSDNQQDKGLMRAWSEMAITKEGQPTSVTYYDGLYRLLLDDIDIVPSYPTSETNPLSFTSGGMRFHALRTGWGATDNTVYIYGHRDNYDHAHWTAGHFEIVDDGVVITKENTGYGYTLISGQGLAHNCLTINGQTSGYGSQLGTYATGDAVVTTNYSDNTFAFVEHDLTNLFNFTGYITEAPVDKYRRKFVYLKSENTLLVHDYVDISSDSDCSFTGTSHGGLNLPCSPRWKKLYQHFQGAVTESGGSYSSSNGGKTLAYKPLLPVGSTKTIINESTTAPWSTAATSDVPTNQRKYNVMIAPASQDTNPAIFLNALNWGSTDGFTPATTSTLNVTGAIGVKVGPSVVIMADNGDISSAAYSVDATTHYIVDLPVNSNVTVTRGSTEVVGSPFFTGEAGVVNFTTSPGEDTYTIGSQVVNPPPSTGAHLTPGGNLSITPAVTGGANIVKVQ